MNKAVIISDIHFNINTLKTASEALRQAVIKANDLGIPLIISGDMHDTKANLRGECVNAILEILHECNAVYVLIGNHDKINEKSNDHSLMFLAHLDNVAVVDDCWYNISLDMYFIPYQHDANEARQYLKGIPKGSTVIMHQGLNGSDSGEYIQDKSALNYYDVADYRVISGHYHRGQTIKTGIPQKGGVGLFSYVGNPFTLGFGESDHPDKGFAVIRDDGMLEYTFLDLPRHQTIKLNANNLNTIAFNDNTILWIKVEGTKEELLTITRDKVAKALYITKDFRLDLVPIDTVTNKETSNTLTNTELMDTLIDSLTNTTAERKDRLKKYWKGLA